MKNTVSFSEFCNGFCGGYSDNFTHAGKRALFDYLEEMEEGCEIEIEFDPIALCCEFSEYDSAVECIEDCGYGFEFDGCDDEEEQEESALEYLRENTTLITFDGGIIIAGF